MTLSAIGSFSKSLIVAAATANAAVNSTMQPR